MKNLLENIKIVTAMDAVVAGTSTQSGSIVIDTLDWSGALFLALLGDVTNTCVLNLSVEGNTANSTSGMAALTGATTGNVVATATSADLKALGVDVYKPSKRYLRPVLARGTANAVINSIVCILYHGRKAPAGLVGDLIGQAAVAA